MAGMLNGYTVFDHIVIVMRGRRAVLLGSVCRPALRETAELAARRVGGVDLVENKIEVLPESRSDDEIRKDVYAQIYGHFALRHYSPEKKPGGPRGFLTLRAVAEDPPAGASHPIHIVVKNGDVILEGVAATDEHRRLAGRLARRANQVRSVVNRLTLALGAADAEPVD